MGDESKPDKWKLIRGTNLKTEDRHVLLTLFLYQGDNGAAFCKQETLAQEIGIDPRSVRRSLKRLNAAGIVRSEWKILNSVPMRTYAIDFQTLKTVQRCDGRTPASYPETSDGRTPASASVGHQRPDHQDTSVLQEDPLNIQRRSRGARAPKTRFQKPTAEQVQSYATELGQPHFDAGKFCDHYESNGWRVGGKASMKCWRASVRQWLRTGGTQGNGRTSGNTNAEQAWQTLKDVLRKIDKSKQYKELLRQQLKPEVYQAADSVGFKALFAIDQFNESKLFAAFSTAMAGVKND
jgi:predicted ArsR family transcriptional regulator